MNILFDEFVLDPNIQIGKEHGKALSMKYVHAINFKKTDLLNLLVFYVNIGTPTFRHWNGKNNFIILSNIK